MNQHHQVHNDQLSSFVFFQRNEGVIFDADVLGAINERNGSNVDEIFYTGYRQSNPRGSRGGKGDMRERLHILLTMQRAITWLAPFECCFETEENNITVLVFYHQLRGNRVVPLILKEIEGD